MLNVYDGKVFKQFVIKLYLQTQRAHYKQKYHCVFLTFYLIKNNKTKIKSYP